MRITVLGSGDAANSAGRGHSCYWIEGLLTGDPGGLMVDFGGTALMALRGRGLRPDRLGTIVFTHLHGDHVGGYPFLYVDAVCSGGRTAPLRLVGPPGLEERLERLLRISYGALAERPRGFELTLRERAPGQEVDLGGATARAFAADHQAPPEQPLCWRFTAADGRAVAFSGDTRICPGLEEAARGVDLLVAECTHLAPPAGGHSTWREWRDLLPRIGARRVVLTHLAQEVRAEVPALLAEVPAGVDVTFADDGLVLEV